MPRTISCTLHCCIYFLEQGLCFQDHPGRTGDPHETSSALTKTSSTQTSSSSVSPDVISSDVWRYASSSHGTIREPHNDAAIGPWGTRSAVTDVMLLGRRTGATYRFGGLVEEEVSPTGADACVRYCERL